MHKDKEPALKKSGIYKINCKQCDKVYIGQTKRNLETRTKHFRNLRLNHTDKSAIASHFWNTGHEINTKKYHVFAPMGRFQLESIYLYTTVENKGKLIPSVSSLI